MTEKWNLPVVGPGGELLPFMSHKDREHLAWALFEGAGGYERELAILEKDDEKFHGIAQKLIFERLPKPNTNANVSVAVTFEQKLKELEAAEKAGVLDAKFVEVPNAPGE